MWGQGRYFGFMLGKIENFCSSALVTAVLSVQFDQTESTKYYIFRVTSILIKWEYYSVFHFTFLLFLNSVFVFDVIASGKGVFYRNTWFDEFLLYIIFTGKTEP